MNLKHFNSPQSLESFASLLRSNGTPESTISRKISAIKSFSDYLKSRQIISKPISSLQTENTPLPLPVSPPNILPKFFNKYLAWSSLALIILGSLYLVYSQIITNAKKQLAYSTASNPTIASRILSFQGRLTDSANNPIVSETGIIFKLFNNSVGGTQLYTSSTGNSQTVIPDENGIFNTVIGKSHGTSIPSSVFSENAEVWLEITTDSETMTPRQQIATVAYAMNSETLQGLPPSASGLKNTVLVIGESGNIYLGETSPSIISTSGTFGIEGQALLLKASDGSGGNITLNPDAQGKIRLITEGSGSTAVGGFIEASNANLSTGNLYSGYINNDNRGYNFIDFSNYNVGTTTLASRFSVSAGGNLTVGGSATFTGLAIGTTGTGTTGVFIDTSGNLYKNIFGALAFADTAIGTTYTFTNGLNLSGSNVGLGGTLTQNTQIGLSSFSLTLGTNTTSPNIYLSSSGSVGIGTTSTARKVWVEGTTQLNNDTWVNGILALGSNQDAGIARFGTQGLGFRVGDTASMVVINNSGNLGIGTTAPGYKLHVNGDALISTRLGIGSTNILYALNVGNTASFNNLYTSGNVGIGTTAPANALTVNSTTSQALFYGFASQTNTPDAKNGEILLGNTSTFRGRISYDGAAVGRLYIDNTYNDNTGDIYFRTKTAGTPVNAMVIYGNGNIGIGITVPTYKLHVVGDANITTNLTIGGSLTANSLPIGTGTSIAYIDSNGIFTKGLLGPYDNYQSWNLEANSTGTTAITSAATVNFVNGVGISLVQSGSTITINNNGVGTTYGATNGISLISGNFGLGGTLTQNTNIGTSSFSLSFQGLGGTQSLYIRSNGNVGIGTTNPGYKLAIDGAGSNAGVTIQNSGTFHGYLTSVAGSGGIIQLNDNSGNDNVEIRGYSGISFFNAGNVGIGNTSPKYKFEVTGDALISTRLGIGSTNVLYALNVGNTANFTNIYTSGNVGIGTTSPSTTLHVNGTGRFGVTTYTQLGGVDQSFSGGNAFLRTATNHDLVLGTNNTQRMQIHNNGGFAIGNTYYDTDPGANNVIIEGNFGIGTTNPGYKLQVVGDANITTNLSVGGSITATGLPVGVGTSVLYIDSNGIVTKGLNIGTTYAATNGLSMVSTNTIGLGGTLTQNTNIGTSSFSLSFQGLGGTQSLFVENTGDVGIGTTNPTEKLHVTGNLKVTGTSAIFGGTNTIGLFPDASGANSFIRLVNSVKTWELYSSSGAISLYDRTAGQDAFVINTSHDVGFGNSITDYSTMTGSNMVIKSTGNVGIGTTSPSQLLHISGASGTAGATAPTLRIDSTTNSQSWTAQSNFAALQFMLPNDGSGQSSGERAAIKAKVEDTTATNIGLAFFTSSGSQASTERLRIDNSGKVGIGTTAPTNILNVVGDSGRVIVQDVATDATDKLARIGTASYTNAEEPFLGVFLQARAANNIVHVGGGTSLGNAATQLSFYTASAIDTTTGTERVRIDSSGNVGIGTTAPGALLEINSSAPVIKISDNGTAIGYLGNSDEFISGGVANDLAFRATNNLVFSIGTVERMRLASTGNFGIGTTAPGYKLDVNGVANVTQLGIGATSSSKLNVVGDANITTNLTIGGSITATGLPAGVGTSVLYIDSSGIVTRGVNIGTTYAATNGLSMVSTNTIGLGGTLTQNTNIGTSSFGLSFLGLGNSQSLFIASSGNVGIGTANPGYKLHVSGSTYLNGQTLIEGANLGLNTGGSGIWAYLDQNAAGDLSVQKNDATPIVTFSQNKDSYFYGNVGIGTTSPGAPLEVASSVASTANGTSYGIKLDNTFTGSIGATPVTNIYSFYNVPNIGLSGTAPQLTNAYINYLQGNIGVATTTTITNLYGEYIAAPSLNGGSTVTNKYALVTEANAGNVGIGTTAPTSKLHVVGDANITTNLTIGGSLTANSLPIGTGTSIAYIDSNGIFTKGLLGPYDNYQSWNLEANSTGTTAITSAATVNFVNGVGISLVQSGSTITINNNGVGTTYGATNGISLISGNFGLGGTLTQNTNIGTSSFSLSFQGLGGTQSLFIGATGNVGIGTTNPIYTLDVTGQGRFSSYLILGTSLLTSNGSAAAPSHTFTSEQTMGMFRITTATLGLGTSSTERMRIDPSGRVGIGTTAPNYKLDVNGVANVTQLGIGGTTTAKLNVVGDANITTNLTVGSSITATGLPVGIGTSVLYIDSSGIVTRGINIGTTYAASNGLSMVSTNTIGLGGTLIQNTNIGTSSFGLSFLGLGNSQALFISSSGHIGVGTTNPLYKLEVTGDALISTRLGIGSTNVLYVLNVGNTANFANIFTSGNVGIGTTNPGAKLHINGNIYLPNAGLIRFDDGVGAYIAEAGNGLEFYTNGSGTAKSIDMDGNGNTELFMFAGGNNNFKITDNVTSTTRFIVQQSGNVGIGTTVPTSKLHVVGDANITTNLTVGGTLTLSQGAQNTYILQSDASGNSTWVAPNSSGIGTTYAVTNGLSVISTNTFGLGGTLTQNTTINTSSFGLGVGTAANSLYTLSVGGTANFVDLYISGSSAIGSTAPIAPLYVGSTASDGISGYFTGYVAGQKFIDLESYADYYLDLANSSDISASLSLERSGSIRFNSSYDIGTSQWQYIQNGPAIKIQSIYNAVDSNGGLFLGAATIGTSMTNIGSSWDSGLFISAKAGSTGNVGIGNTSPNYKLEVTGDALISTRLGIGSTNILYALNVGNTANFNNLYTSGNVGIGTTSPRGLFQVGADVGGTGPFMVFNVGGSGYLGIGTTSPAYKLDVIGTGNFYNLISHNLILSGSNANILSAYKGFDGYTNFSGGIGTGGIGKDSITNAQRLTSQGNLVNIGSIQAGQTWLTAAGTFVSKVDYATGTTPSGIALGDVNGDGKADMVTSNAGTNNASVFINNGSGTFATKVDYTTNSGPLGIALGDVNGDGKADMVVANTGSGNVSVFINNGDGTFVAKVDYSSASTPAEIALGDVNGDGKADIIAANSSSDNASIFINNGNGTFATKVDYTTGTTPNGIALGDVNGDGKADVVTANTGTTSASVLINNGNGTFATKVDYTTGTTPSKIALGDVNGDGKADMVVSNNGTTSASVFIMGAGNTFATKVDYATQTSPKGIALGDVNGDGKADMVVANSGTTSASVFINSGTGTFATKVDYATGSTPFDIALGDVNGDGKADMVVANSGTTSASVFINTPSTMLYAQASNGFVGIGTTAPSAKLSISNNVATGFLDSFSEYQQVLWDSGAAGGSYGFGVKSNNLVFNSGAGGYSFDKGGTSTSMVIDTSGNVGIGTTAPGYKLQVIGDVAVGNANNGIIWSGSDGTFGNQIVRQASDGSMKLTSGQAHILLMPTSNVGIGTTGPATKLDIDTGSNTLGLRLRGALETTEIGDIYLGSSGQLVITTSNTGSTSPFIEIDAEDDQYGLVVRDSGVSSSVFANLYMNDAATDYLNIVTGAANSTTGLVIQTGGNVGIGTTNPVSMLDVQGNITLGSDTGTTAAIQTNSSDMRMDFITNRTTDGSNAFVFFVGGGTTSAFSIVDNGNVNINNGDLDVAGSVTLDLTSPTNADFALCHTTNGAANNETIFDCNGSVTADYAELYPTKNDVDFGDIVSLSNTTTTVDRIEGNPDGSSQNPVRQTISVLEKSTTTNRTNSIGIVSANWGDFSSTGHNTIKEEDHPLPIALSGRVPVKISTSSEAINIGDPITTSTDPGRGIKSTSAGRIVGTALESWSPSNPTDKILVFVNNIWYDPDIQLTATGDINVNYNISDSVLASLGYQDSQNEIEAATYSLSDSVSQPVTRLAQFAQVSVAKITAGLVKTTNLIAQNIVAKKVISPEIKTTTLTPLDEITDTITIDGNLKAKEASFSSIYADQIINQEGNIADTITQKIASLREEITDLMARETPATPSAILLASETWDTSVATDSATIEIADMSITNNLIIGANLVVNGQTNLSKTYISDTLAVGQIAIKDNIIETTQNQLLIQPSGIGLVNILNSRLIVSDDGNITINGKVSGSDATFSGSLIANMLQAESARLNSLEATNATIGKLNIATESAQSLIVATESLPAEASTQSATVSTNASAGNVTLPAGKTELVVENSKITSSSMVYLTPNGSTQNQTIYVKAKTDSSFTIGLDNPLSLDVNINWWIIN